MRLASAALVAAAIAAVPDQVDLQHLGRRLEHGLADGLGLEERPEVRRLDVVADRRGLRALAERLREREAQRDHRDQQRDLLVAGVEQVLSAAAVAAMFAVVLHLVLSFVLNRVDAVAHGESSLVRREEGVADGMAVRKRVRGAVERL